MKHFCLLSFAVTLFSPTIALAGNLDYTKTPVDIIFKNGNYAEFSLGYVAPNITGSDTSGSTISNVGHNVGLVGGALKLHISDDLSLAFLYDQPYGVNVSYAGDPTSTRYGGTTAKAETNEFSILIGYHVTDRIMIYGGPRLVGAKGAVALSGSSYNPLNGYNVSFSEDYGSGYVLGAAYDIPQIALRAAFTYHSSVDVDMKTVEVFPGAAPVATGSTRSTLPQSAKLQFQSGITESTLVFGSVRWSDWSNFTLNPPSSAPNLAVMSNAWTYEAGVGHQFTNKFSASLTYSYEHEEGDNFSSPLAPTKGYNSIAVGGEYQLTSSTTISGSIQYYWLGDALLESRPNSAVHDNFSKNNVIGIGLKVGFDF